MCSKPSIPGYAVQSGEDPASLRIFTQCLGLISLSVMLCGCNSIYHQAWATMPPDAEARLALSLKEARTVERSASDTARQLLAVLQRGGNGDLIRVGFDRLERNSLELDRKLLAVRDERGAGVAASEEVEALSKQAKTWRQFAAENRFVEPHIAARRLEALLGSQLLGEVHRSPAVELD